LIYLEYTKITNYYTRGKGVNMFFLPIVISFIFIVIQAMVSKKGIVWGSFAVAVLYTLMIMSFFQSSNLLAILIILCLTFWVMFFGAIAMR
jgi:hypothetical protein